MPAGSGNVSKKEKCELTRLRKDLPSRRNSRGTGVTNSSEWHSQTVHLAQPSMQPGQEMGLAGFPRFWLLFSSGLNRDGGGCYLMCENHREKEKGGACFSVVRGDG